MSFLGTTFDSFATTPQPVSLDPNGPDTIPSASGPLTDQQILDLVGATAMLRNNSLGSHSQPTYDQIRQALQTLQLVGFNLSGCSGVSTASATLLNTAGKTALKFSTGAIAPVSLAGSQSGGAALSGLAIGGLATGILAGVGVALTVFAVIFAHHAAKVAEERRILCASVPAVQTTLQTILNAVAQGQITYQQGELELDQIYSDFSQTVQPILKQGQTHCNAACGWRWQLSAIIIKLKNQFDFAEYYSSKKKRNWILIALVAAAAFVLVRGRKG